MCSRDGASLVTTGASTQAGIVTAPTMPGVAGARTAAAVAPSVTPNPSPSSSEEAKFDPLVDSVLAGRYKVIRRIGEGGMGAVYEARHTLIGKRVAVKVLLEKFLAKSDFVARLLQEARLASSIGHENIVDVTDFGTTDDGRSFVVMEFLEGEPLSELTMREAPLPIERCLRIARQAASALGAAHDKGIYHRDVKPENIYLVKRGDADFVKVVDFGISKAVKPGGDEGPEVYRLTHTGLLLGTPLYMSPEQARGEDNLDHRVDIWALGVLLYECLTGEVPFRANNYLQIIAQVLNHMPAPPSKLRPELGIPDAVEMVVMRAMEKDRTRRYQTMAELEQDIDRLLAGDQNVGLLPVGEGAAPASRGARRWPLLLAVGVALSGGVVAALRHPPKPPEASVAPATAPAPLQPATPLAAPPPAVVPPAAEVTAPARPPAAVPVARKRARVAPPTAAPTPAQHSGPAKSVKRGVLAPSSKEGYPDK